MRQQEHYGRLFRAALTASLMLVAIAGAAVAGPLEDLALEKLEKEILPDSGGEYAKALQFLRPRADRGEAVPQYLLGVMYAGSRGVPQDFAEAAKWYRLSADQGIALAQFNLGLLYDLGGDGVPQNYAEAIKWFGLAANQGNAEAQFDLGKMYDEGHGVAQDYAEAARWYLRAANQGIDRAQFRLGYMYREGQGVPQDRVRAHMWFLVQKFALDTGERYMTPEQIAEAQKLAYEWKPKLEE